MSKLGQKLPYWLRKHRPSAGFTTVELLATLIIAGTFVVVFYQLYATADVVATRSSMLARANDITYRKLQQYENTSFRTIPTPGGTTAAEVEDFTGELPDNMREGASAVVNTALLTPTLKAVNVKTTYGVNGDQRIIEYTAYIQESGVGR